MWWVVAHVVVDGCGVVVVTAVRKRYRLEKGGMRSTRKGKEEINLKMRED